MLLYNLALILETNLVILFVFYFKMTFIISFNQHFFKGYQEHREGVALGILLILKQFKELII